MTAADSRTASRVGGLLAVAAALAAAVLALCWAARAEPVSLQGARGVIGVGFAGLGTWLSWTDLRTHRLPTRPVLIGAATVLAVVLVQAAGEHDPAPALRAALGGVGLSLAFALVALAVPGAVGGGDVKLVLLTGGISAWAGWGAFAVSLAAAFLLAGIVAAALLALRRASRKTRIPFGPFLCAGVWIGVLIG